MFTAYGIHHDGREEGHAECGSLDEVFMHLREMLASEAADEGGAIFASYGFRTDAIAKPDDGAEAPTADQFDARPPLALSRSLRPAPPSKRDLMAHLPVCNTVLSEQARQAILLAASQVRYRPRQRHKPASALQKCRTRGQ